MNVIILLISYLGSKCSNVDFLTLFFYLKLIIDIYDELKPVLNYKR